MPKVVIVGGGGGVGASVAFNLLIGGGGFDVVMTDRRPEMVRSHVLDLEQVLEQGAPGTVREGSDDDIPRADILVVTAALPLTVNDSRMVYLDGNARIVTAVVDLLPDDWPGVLLLVTNPVDPLCTIVQPAHRARPPQGPRLHDQRLAAPANGHRPRAGCSARPDHRLVDRRAWPVDGPPVGPRATRRRRSGA